MKVAFVVNDLQLSGGVGVVVQHARQLVARHGFDVTLVLARPQEAPSWRYETLEGLHVASLPDAHAERFDVAVGTWWETAQATFQLDAARHALFLQSLEDRFYTAGSAARYGAQLVPDLPVSAFITEARWIRDTLRALRPETPVHLVRNGIDKAVFAGPREVEPRLRGPLRVLVEGNLGSWFKHVPEAVGAAAAMQEAREVTLVTGMPGDAKGLPVDRVLSGLTHAEMAALYAETDVVLKLSAVEGMFGPPLEGFHMGATCVVTPVTGHDEYVEHGWNGLLCDWDDVRGTTRLLDLLARDRRLLHLLRHNALLTARGWPDWEQQGQVMAAILRRIARDPAPPVAPGVAQLLADARHALEEHHRHLRALDVATARLDRFDHVLRTTPVGRLLDLRRHKALHIARRVVRVLRGREALRRPRGRLDRTLRRLGR